MLSYNCLLWYIVFEVISLFRDKIKFLRKKYGYTQQFLADTIHLTQQAVAKWEVGAAEPDHATLLAIANLFGVTTDYLLSDTFIPVSSPSCKGDPSLFVWLSASKKDAIYSCLLPALQAQSLTEQEAISFSGAVDNFFPRFHSVDSDAHLQPGPCPLIDILKVADFLSVREEVADILCEPDADPYPEESKQLILDLSSAFYRHRIAYKNAPPVIQSTIQTVVNALLAPYESSLDEDK